MNRDKLEQLANNAIDDYFEDVNIDSIVDDIASKILDVHKIEDYDDINFLKKLSKKRYIEMGLKFKSKFPKSLLNEIKWTGGDLSKCKIYYINRGSPDDVAIVEGSRIIEIDKGFLVLEGIPYETYIPYHRIIKIEYDDQTIFERLKKLEGKY